MVTGQGELNSEGQSGVASELSQRRATAKKLAMLKATAAVAKVNPAAGVALKAMQNPWMRRIAIVNAIFWPALYLLFVGALMYAYTHKWDMLKIFLS